MLVKNSVELRRLVEKHFIQFDNNTRQRKTKINVNFPDFTIELSENSKQVYICFQVKDIDTPGSLDIVLSNLKIQESYAIYMTECYVQDLEKYLKDTILIVNDFFSDAYTAKKRKLLGVFVQESIDFNNPDIIYSSATKTKKYIGSKASRAFPGGGSGKKW